MPMTFAGVLIAISGVLFIVLMGLAKQIYTNSLVKIIGSLVIVFGVILATIPYWASYHALHSACVLTDNRAINIFSDKPCESIPYTSQDIQKPFVLSGSGDAQTLKFYRQSYSSTATFGTRKTRNAFEDISDGTTALEILTAHTIRAGTQN
jgi:energy-coupling factor transporter transmembrane protein EcfT